MVNDPEADEQEIEAFTYLLKVREEAARIKTQPHTRNNIGSDKVKESQIKEDEKII